MNINGSGKYDDLCTLVREKAEAQGAVVIVINGNKGLGFSVQADAFTIMNLPGILRHMANQIDGKGN